jgi:hypothetical protein
MQLLLPCSSSASSSTFRSVRNTVATITLTLMALLLASSPLFAAATVSSGSDSTATLTAITRFRNFDSGGGEEVRLTASGGTSGGNLTWSGTTSVTRCIQFAYDGAAVTTKVAATSACSFATGAVTVSRTGSIGNLNYLEINVVKNNPTTSVSLASVTLNSDPIGSFTLNAGAANTKWNVTGVTMTSGFTVTGVVTIVGLNSGGDSNFIELSAGYVAPSDTSGPVTSNVTITPSTVILNGSAVLSANVDDSTTGGSTIQSAEYALNGSTTYNGMTAQDLAFDEVSEDVEATFTATQLGPNSACVHGTDALNNPGVDNCQNFTVTYNFEGFFSPIDNTFLNIVKAGQAVPAKWRLTDALEAAISDPASFEGLYSYPIGCESLQGNPTDWVEEVASGNSGLQYNGDGYWQFNWKTSKAYAGTCRAMYVKFNSGTTTPVVTFQFK